MDRLIISHKAPLLKAGVWKHEHASDTQDLPLNWRRVLSLQDETPFVWEGFRGLVNPMDKTRTIEMIWPRNTEWRTMEHALNAARIALVTGTSGAAYLFSQSSGSDLGLGSGDLASRSRKLVLLDSELVRLWFSIRRHVWISIARAKFHDLDSLPSRVLRATRSAELYSLEESRHGPTLLDRLDFLEEIRATL